MDGIAEVEGAGKGDGGKVGRGSKLEDGGRDGGRGSGSRGLRAGAGVSGQGGSPLLLHSRAGSSAP